MNISQLIEKFDVFLCDIYGIIHDGKFPYKGAIEMLQKIKKLNKKVFFVSNAPRLGAVVSKRLEYFGITPDLHLGVNTPGEVFLHDCKEGKYCGKYFAMFEYPEDLDLLNGVNTLQRVENIDEADIFVNYGPLPYTDCMVILHQALKRNLHMICVNADKKAKQKKSVDSKEFVDIICGGYFGIAYEELGGKVTYYGKPHKSIYDFVFEKYNLSKNDKILAIGDSLETDIFGANNANIQSCLVLTGLHMDVVQNGKINEQLLQNACKENDARPDFVLLNIE